MKANTAPSGVGFAATGGILLIMLWSSGTGKFQVAYGFTRDLNQPVPHIRRIAQTMIHGTRDAHTCSVVGFGPMAGGFGMVLAESSLLRNAGDSHISFGFHSLRKPIRQAIEINDAPMSTIQGLM